MKILAKQYKVLFSKELSFLLFLLLMCIQSFSQNFSIQPVVRNNDTNCYQICYSIDNEIADSCFIYFFGQMTTLIDNEAKCNELLVLYITNGTNSVTKGLTIIMERYMWINAKIFKQSSISISKKKLKGYDIRIENGKLKLSNNNLTKKEYIISKYENLSNLYKEIFNTVDLMD